MAGPLVTRSGVDISWAMIIARVVLPRPGGPDSNTWSEARPRRRAASRTSPSCSRTRTWPITSSRVRGRSPASTARSSPSASAVVREAREASSWASSSSRGDIGSRPAQAAERGPQEGGDVGRAVGGRAGRDLVGDGLDGPVGVLGPPAEPDQALLHLVTPRLRDRRAWGGARGRRRPDPVLELEDDPLRPLLTDAGDRGQGADVVARNSTAYGVGREHREHRLGQLRADATGGLDELEDLLLVVVDEAEQGQGVLAHHHRGRQRCDLTDPELGQRVRRAHQLEPDTADLEDRAGEGEGGDLAADEGDHRTLRPAAARAASMRACAPPRQMWGMARARASAASAGLGGASSRRMRVTIAPTCALSARPLPDTAALTSLGVCSASGSPRLAAATIATPLAWAVPMTVLESERAQTRSHATAAWRCS